MEADTSVGHIIMAIVCDGVGGFEEGELASSTLIQRFVVWFCSMLPRYLSIDDSWDKSDVRLLEEIWRTILMQANEDLCQYASSCGHSLGTTFSGMITCNDRYIFGHVGDCRIYSIAETECTQLTKDQTIVQNAIDAGLMTEIEAKHHPHRHVILQAVGSQDVLSPVMQSGSIDSNCIYMICCDGARNSVSASEIHELFRPSSVSGDDGLQRRCGQLASLCKSRNEKDNISVLAFGPEELIGPSNQVYGRCREEMCVFNAICSLAELEDENLGALDRDSSFEITRCAVSIHSERIVGAHGQVVALSDVVDYQDWTK